MVVPLEQHDVGAEPSRRDRGSSARRAATDDEDIARAVHGSGPGRLLEMGGRRGPHGDPRVIGPGRSNLRPTWLGPMGYSAR